MAEKLDAEAADADGVIAPAPPAEDMNTASVITNDTKAPAVLSMFDSYDPPNAAQRAAARRLGIRSWGGYLSSPGHPSGWGTPALNACIDDGLGLVPIAVMPLTPAGRQAAGGSATADAMVHQLDELTGTGGGISLDVEPGAYNGPSDLDDTERRAWRADCMAWYHEFFGRLRARHPIHWHHSSTYANPSTLLAVASFHEPHKSSKWVWAAYWPTPAPKEAPASVAVIPELASNLWPDHRAWQYHGPAIFDGLGVDLSVHVSNFPTRRRTTSNTGPTHPTPSKVTVVVNGSNAGTYELPVSLEVKDA